jgi:cobalt-zinc-cadmium efflux system protein
MYEAYMRITSPPEVQSFTMIVVAAAGLAVNFAGVKILGGHPHSDHEHESKGAIVENLNIEGARLEVLSDALGSIGVVTAGLVIMLTGFYLADIIASIALALFILPRTWLLLRKSIHILLEGTPSHISYEEVKNAILGIRGVTGIFDLHIWTITSGMNALSAHVVVIDTDRAQEILKEVSSLLEKRFGIIHSTIQIESYHPDSESHNF